MPPPKLHSPPPPPPPGSAPPKPGLPPQAQFSPLQAQFAPPTPPAQFSSPKARFAPPSLVQLPSTPVLSPTAWFGSPQAWFAPLPKPSPAPSPVQPPSLVHPPPPCLPPHARFILPSPVQPLSPAHLPKAQFSPPPPPPSLVRPPSPQCSRPRHPLSTEGPPQLGVLGCSQGCQGLPVTHKCTPAPPQPQRGLLGSAPPGKGTGQSPPLAPSTAANPWEEPTKQPSCKKVLVFFLLLFKIYLQTFSPRDNSIARALGSAHATVETSHLQNPTHICFLPPSAGSHTAKRPRVPRRSRTLGAQRRVHINNSVKKPDMGALQTRRPCRCSAHAPPPESDRCQEEKGGTWDVSAPMSVAGRKTYPQGLPKLPALRSEQSTGLFLLYPADERSLRAYNDLIYGYLTKQRAGMEIS